MSVVCYFLKLENTVLQQNKNPQQNHDTYLIVVIIMIWSHFEDSAWVNKAFISISSKWKILRGQPSQAGC
jgi:hypothetical protein